MDFSYSAKTAALQQRVMAFVNDHVKPAEAEFKAEMDAFRAEGNPWRGTRAMEKLKDKARSAGLWNMFLPDSEMGAGLSNLEYAPICEIMGRFPLTGEAMNCSAPDTGNMEILERFGTPEQKERWLKPLLEGRIRSGFAMTEPDVASSDATNIACRMERDGNDYVINGRKWWTSGAPDPRCEVLIVMGKTDPTASTYRQQSMILVPKDTPGVKLERALSVFGYDHAPHGHGEVTFKNVRVPAANVLLGEGRGFEIAQARLGPGRIHHCMRLVGMAERALELMCRRALVRKPFGKLLSRPGRDARAHRQRPHPDRPGALPGAQRGRSHGQGGQQGGQEGDRDDQGGGAQHGLPGDRLGDAGARRRRRQRRHAAGRDVRRARTVRFADGPDEVHRNQIGKMETRTVPARPPRA